MKQVLALVCLFLVIMANVVLRPDNRVVFDLMASTRIGNWIWSPGVIERKKWHAFCNIIVVGLADILLYLDFN